ncbi:hypothetical protein HAX54_004782, partial [Datura stramonium]|nr:hypothetical protein [Datura stramonium]
MNVPIANPRGDQQRIVQSEHLAFKLLSTNIGISSEKNPYGFKGGVGFRRQRCNGEDKLGIRRRSGR